MKAQGWHSSDLIHFHSLLFQSTSTISLSLSLSQFTCVYTSLSSIM